MVYVSSFDPDDHLILCVCFLHLLDHHDAELWELHRSRTVRVHLARVNNGFVWVDWLPGFRKLLI